MNTLNKINLNQTAYTRPAQVAFKGYGFGINPMNDSSYSPYSPHLKSQDVAADKFVKEPSNENVSFLGMISKTVSNLMDKVYENSTSDLVLNSIENDDVKTSLNLIG